MTEPAPDNAESVKEWSDRMDEIMQTAVDKAIEENRRLGIYTDEPQPSEKVAEDHERE